ncbi:hypothetical protein N7478_010776 [Penicillium angulare]|uniref:uncharacterized protein n=1 Tax=Penicillium angulare TaxID=116970 RepID=UPI002541C24A|nr:uncharacterized protein N7478_010776 [Penicillium angulare]KAJ5263171.1 hypothetical protein N7478_010776 [Penicillium angulare]
MVHTTRGPFKCIMITRIQDRSSVITKSSTGNDLKVDHPGHLDPQPFSDQSATGGGPGGQPPPHRRVSFGDR